MSEIINQLYLSNNFKTDYISSNIFRYS